MAVIEEQSGETPPPRRKTKRDRLDERRLAKLALVQEQVASGSLVIRKMTAEERLRYPLLATTPRRRGRS